MIGVFISELYRVGIWMPEIWVPYLENAKVNLDQNAFYTIYVIFQLADLYKGKIGPEI